MQVAREDCIDHHGRPRKLGPVHFKVAQPARLCLAFDELHILHGHQGDKDGAKLLRHGDFFHLLASGRRHPAGESDHTHGKRHHHLSHCSPPLGSAAIHCGPRAGKTHAADQGPPCRLRAALARLQSVARASEARRAGCFHSNAAAGAPRQRGLDCACWQRHGPTHAKVRRIAPRTASSRAWVAGNRRCRWGCAGPSSLASTTSPNCARSTGKARQGETVAMIRPQHREVAAALVIDTRGRFLLQQRDNVPGILFPGRIGLFGGHREGDETFLECVVREIHVELGVFLPALRVPALARYRGTDPYISGATLWRELYLTTDVPVERLRITEGSLLIAELEDVPALAPRFAPSAQAAIRAFLARTGRAENL